MVRFAPWVLVLSIGCGPSLRLVEQSHVYFERCYSADFDARVASDEKRACWTAWLQHYTMGEPLERREYAEQRLYAIAHGEAIPRLPGLPQTVLAQHVTPFTAVSAPVEREEMGAESESELQIAQEENVSEVEPTPPPAAPPPPRHMPPLPATANQACAMAACRPLWEQCVEACPAEGHDCVTACRVELNGCARGCF